MVFSCRPSLGVVCVVIAALSLAAAAAQSQRCRTQPHPVHPLFPIRRVPIYDVAIVGGGYAGVIFARSIFEQCGDVADAQLSNGKINRHCPTMRAVMLTGNESAAFGTMCSTLDTYATFIGTENKRRVASMTDQWTRLATAVDPPTCPTGPLVHTLQTDTVETCDGSAIDSAAASKSPTSPPHSPLHVKWGHSATRVVAITAGGALADLGACSGTRVGSIDGRNSRKGRFAVVHSSASVGSQGGVFHARRLVIATGHVLKERPGWATSPSSPSRAIVGSEGLRHALRAASGTGRCPDIARQRRDLARALSHYPLVSPMNDNADIKSAHGDESSSSPVESVMRIALAGRGATMHEVIKILERLLRRPDKTEHDQNGRLTYWYALEGASNVRVEIVVYSSLDPAANEELYALFERTVVKEIPRLNSGGDLVSGQYGPASEYEHHTRAVRARLRSLHSSGTLRLESGAFAWDAAVVNADGSIQAAVSRPWVPPLPPELLHGPRHALSVVIDCAPYTHLSRKSGFATHDVATGSNVLSVFLSDLYSQGVLRWGLNTGIPEVVPEYQHLVAVGGAGFTMPFEWNVFEWEKQGSAMCELLGLHELQYRKHCDNPPPAKDGAT